MLVENSWNYIYSLSLIKNFRIYDYANTFPFKSLLVNLLQDTKCLPLHFNVLVGSVNRCWLTAVLQVCPTFRRHADRRLSEVWGLWCLHVHGLHSATAGAETAAAQSPRWVLVVSLFSHQAKKNIMCSLWLVSIYVVISFNDQQRSVYLNIIKINCVWGSVPLGDIQHNSVWVYDGARIFRFKYMTIVFWFYCPADLKITTAPNNIRVSEGSTALLPCVVSGDNVNIGWSR